MITSQEPLLAPFLYGDDVFLELSDPSVFHSEPMRPLRGLTATEIQSRQLLLQWEPVGYNLTRCHTYSLSLCYRYSTATGGGAGGNNATVRECLSVERNTSRFTLRDLPPFHAVHVRLALTNPEGKKESREVTFQTEEDSEYTLFFFFLHGTVRDVWERGLVGQIQTCFLKFC